MNHRDLRDEERDFWGRLALGQSPEFLLTATLKRNYADSVSVQAFKFAMRAIQRRIPSPRVLRGVATLERTWKKAAFEDQLHLHALLWGVVGNVSEPRAFMSEVTTKAFMKLRDAQGRKMTRPSNVHLQYVYSSGATSYATKDVGKTNRRRSRVWLVTPNGFDTTSDYYQ